MSPTVDVVARRDRLRGLLRGADVDAAVITSLVNVRYLSGFTGSAGAVLVMTDGGERLATDFRYLEQVAREVPDVAVLQSRTLGPSLVEAAVAAGARRVGFEEHVVPVAQHDALVAAAGEAELVRLGRPVERLRRVKDEAEIALLREACAVGDRAFAALLGTLGPGQTEREIARRLELLLLDVGGDAVGFDSIVAAGPHSAVPHHTPGDRPVAAGEFLKCDFGATVGGYHADMTRTVIVGGPVAAWQEDLYQVVRAAQRCGRQALAPGAVLGDVDRAARQVVEEAGFAEQFGHGLGHGVGLEIHEDPFLAPAATGTLDAGTPLTVEPGVYLPGRGGVRIEDTLVVREAGPELLTTTTKELLVV